MNNVRKATLLLLLLQSIVFAASAQVEWGLRGFENRGRGHTMFYLGYNYPYGKLTHTMSSAYFDEFTGKTNSTVVKRKYTASNTLGATLGWSQQVARLTEIAALTADISVIYNQMTFSTGKVTYGNMKEQSFNYDIAMQQISVPVGVTVLRGPDAIKDKSFKMSYGIGLGVAPTQTTMTYGKYDNAVWNFHPYVKGEIGFFAGVLFKLRALVNFGQTDLIAHNAETYSAEPSIAATNSRVSLGTTANFQFLIYPFSMGYKKSMWWR